MPYATTVGSLEPGSTMTVRLAGGTLDAYHPASGEPRNRFTVTATARKNGPQPAAPTIRALQHGVTIDAPALGELLVRAPQGVDVSIVNRSGNVHVTDITGNADVAAGSGDIVIMLPGYAQAHAGTGNVSVRMGSEDWPGVLHFSSGRGDVDVWIRDKASFHARLHTADGTIFTDFNLRGTASGKAETIDGDVNGGGTHGVDIETKAGEIRLLQLHPQP